MNEHGNIVALVKQKAGTIVLGGVLLGALTFAFLVVTEKNFRTRTDFLVVQDQKTGPQDFFSLSKSIEYTGKVMGEAVYSQLFIDEVVKTGKVNDEFLPFDAKARMKAWSKIVQVNRDPQLGIISVTVFSNNRTEAINLSEGVSEVLSKKNYLFRGSGLDIDFRIISGPITEGNPSLERIALAVGGGFVLGALLTLMFVYYRKNNTSESITFGRSEMRPDEYMNKVRQANQE